jgi:DNA-binding LacI/PurR family transcriptional regulator
MARINEDSKRARVLAAIKQRLRSGRWKPGAQLPTRTELIQTLKVSPVTLQKVIDELIRDGFVESRGRDGTFAADAPPFKRNYGFVLNGLNSERQDWLHYWRVMESEAKAHFSGSKRQPVFYYGINRPLSPEMDRLRDDLNSQRLAGVFFSDMPYFLMNDPLTAQKITPLVSVVSKKKAEGKLSSIQFGTDRFFEIALKETASAGCTRVGLITPWEDPRQHVAQFMSIAQSLGLQTHARWCQYTPHSVAGRMWSTHATQAILAGEKNERPDALLIYDDNHIEGVMAGLKEARCFGPSDCLVVAHTNFPWPIPSPYPLVRVGVDIREVVRAAVGEIDRRQNGEEPQGIYIPLQVENEIARNSSAVAR